MLNNHSPKIHQSVSSNDHLYQITTDSMPSRSMNKLESSNPLPDESPTRFSFLECDIRSRRDVCTSSQSAVDRLTAESSYTVDLRFRREKGNRKLEILRGSRSIVLFVSHEPIRTRLLPMHRREN